MTEELNKTEARQGDQRRTNVTALVAGLVLIIVLFVIIFVIWGPGGH